MSTRTTRRNIGTSLNPMASIGRMKCFMFSHTPRNMGACPAAGRALRTTANTQTNTIALTNGGVATIPNAAPDIHRSISLLLR